MDLSEYERRKFELAEVLRSASALLPNEEHDRHGRIRDLQARLADDRFNLVVIGGFSRGKTSLMNAVLGSDRLPTGIVPLTSVITTVTYGSKEQVVLEYQDRGLRSQIALQALPDYITLCGNVWFHRVAPHTGEKSRLPCRIDFLNGTESMQEGSLPDSFPNRLVCSATMDFKVSQPKICTRNSLSNLSKIADTAPVILRSTGRLLRW